MRRAFARLWRAYWAAVTRRQTVGEWESGQL